MTAKEIQKIICAAESLKRNLCCENVKYLFSVSWEYDVLSLNKAEYLTDFEVKISRADFKADAKKKKISYYTNPFYYRIPNYFYYVVPENLVSRDEVPKFAGLIYVINGELKTIKRAPLMHKTKHPTFEIILKFCRVMQERLHLGKCALTLKNERIRAEWKAREAEIERQSALEENSTLFGGNGNLF